LPAGFHRVRRFGWLHPSAKAKRERIQGLLDDRAPGAETANLAVLDSESEPDEVDPFDELERAEGFVETQTFAPVKSPTPPPQCPRCGRPMQCLARWRPAHRGSGLASGARAPPVM